MWLSHVEVSTVPVLRPLLTHLIMSRTHTATDSGGVARAILSRRRACRLFVLTGWFYDPEIHHSKEGPASLLAHWQVPYSRTLGVSHTHPLYQQRSMIASAGGAAAAAGRGARHRATAGQWCHDTQKCSAGGAGSYMAHYQFSMMLQCVW